MADDAQQGFRARIASMFQTFLFQRHQVEQQQTQKSDRQVADGYTRGADDPDNRRAAPALTWDKYMGDVKAREVQEQAHRDEEARHPSGGNALSRAAEGEVRQAQELAARLERQMPRDTSVPDRADGLRAAFEAAQQRFEAQQRQKGRQQGRGF